MKLLNSWILFALIFLSCTEKHNLDGLEGYFEGCFSDYNKKLTDVIVADIFTPPVASRIYAYSNIAAYEGIRFMDPNYLTLGGQLHGLDQMPHPDPDRDYYYPMSAIVAFTEVAKNLVFNKEAIQDLQDEMLDQVKTIGIDNDIYENSLELGKSIGAIVLDRSSHDGYLERTALARYSIDDKPGSWKPTPPDYMEAIEPHWNTIETFVLDSASQFDPGMPTSFDIEQSSHFYQEAREVYQTVIDLDSSQLEIAKFWDCNPNISTTRGHVMFFEQQISPGGHWVHITAQVLDEEEIGMVESASVLAQVSIGLADAFISCWDQKYKSKLVRPETYINKYIDSDWAPVLQTPAFPEHTSGHSVASSAAATILTSIFGDNFAFVDKTEIPYGLPARSYRSFEMAAQEAAISRLYGGIHYKPAIVLGVNQGKEVGKYVLQNIQLTN